MKADKSLPGESKPKVCPECGKDLSGQNILTHRDSHWGGNRPDPKKYPVAARRWTILTRMAQGE